MSAVVAMRSSVAFTRIQHVTGLRVGGPGAAKALEKLSPRDLHLRDGQVAHTILLRDDARPLADLYVGRDDEEYVLLAEGISPDALEVLVRGAADAEVTVADMMRTHGIISLDGPYAWELFAEIAGPEVIGQPYMTLFTTNDLMAIRAGKTGEYGYYLIVPTERVEPLCAALRDRGAPFDVAEGDLAALDQCALENWYFNIRREGQADATPIELQLQWRVSRKKAFVGSEALAESRRTATRRLVMCAAPSEIAIGDRVMVGDESIGVVVNAGFSPVRKDWVATALVDRAYSQAGIRAYTVAHAEVAVPIVTLAAPALDNRSLYVNPQSHSYQTRQEVQYPPVIPPPRT